jgi:hypothetical protein
MFKGLKIEEASKKFGIISCYPIFALSNQPFSAQLKLVRQSPFKKS